MTTRSFALAAGILYIGAGLLGFVPGLTRPGHVDAPHLTVSAGYGYLLGLFPVNILHNFVHLGIGAWGLISCRTASTACGFARGLALLYGVLAVMGLFPAFNTTFGFIPLFGHDVWLHAGTALIAAYFGWAAPDAVAEPLVRTGSGRVEVYQDESDTRPQA